MIGYYIDSASVYNCISIYIQLRFEDDYCSKYPEYTDSETDRIRIFRFTSIAFWFDFKICYCIYKYFKACLAMCLTTSGQNITVHFIGYLKRLMILFSPSFLFFSSRCKFSTLMNKKDELVQFKKEKLTKHHCPFHPTFKNLVDFVFFFLFFFPNCKILYIYWQ